MLLTTKVRVSMRRLTASIGCLKGFAIRRPVRSVHQLLSRPEWSGLARRLQRTTDTGSESSLGGSHLHETVRTYQCNISLNVVPWYGESQIHRSGPAGRDMAGNATQIVCLMPE